MPGYCSLGSRSGSRAPCLTPCWLAWGCTLLFLDVGCLSPSWTFVCDEDSTSLRDLVLRLRNLEEGVCCLCWKVLVTPPQRRVHSRGLGPKSTGAVTSLLRNVCFFSNIGRRQPHQNGVYCYMYFVIIICLWYKSFVCADFAILPRKCTGNAPHACCRSLPHNQNIRPLVERIQNTVTTARPNFVSIDNKFWISLGWKFAYVLLMSICYVWYWSVCLYRNYCVWIVRAVLWGRARHPGGIPKCRPTQRHLAANFPTNESTQVRNPRTQLHENVITRGKPLLQPISELFLSKSTCLGAIPNADSAISWRVDNCQVNISRLLWL